MKTIISTAVAALLAGFGVAASAQNVQIYGRLDQGYRYDSEGNKYGRNVAKNQIATGSFNGLGFRGTEDLGGGLQAFFHIEHRFAADTGVANTTFWDEISIVGLRGGFGQISLGRQGGPFGAAPDPDAFGGDTVGGRGERKAGADDKYTNSVVYGTPDFNGFSAAIGASLPEGQRVDPDDETSRKLKTGVSGVLKYAAGPLTAGVSFASRSNRDNAWALGGTYDFGVAKALLAVAHNDGDESGIERTTFDIGAIVPLGQGSLRAKFNHDKIDSDAGDAKVKNFGVGYWYDLSKRTLLYTDLGVEKADGIKRVTRFDAGIRHNF